MSNVLAGRIEKAEGPSTMATADVRSEVAHYVSWSASAPHGQRTATEDMDAALRRSRMEVLRTVAAMRAGEEELIGPKPSRLAQAPSPAAHLPHSRPRKALYQRRATARYKTIADLTADPSADSAGAMPSSRGAVTDAVDTPSSGCAAVVRRDPRRAVAAKHLAAVEVVLPQISPRVELSLREDTRCLGAVKPYSLACHPRYNDSSRRVAQPAVDSNEDYIDRMQCCRPSKGLYVYFE